MKHLFTTKVKIVLVVALLLGIALAVIGNLTGISIPDMFVKGILTPIRSGVNSLTTRVEQLYSYMFEYESLKAENEALKEELAAIQDQARRMDSLLQENDRLRELLELKESNEDYQYVDGYIISWSSTEWSSTFTINRGTNVGIEEGMCAITSNGELVGLVSEVGPNYAVIKSILDSSLEISATISSSGYNGMVQGGYFSGQAGMLRMNYLPTSATIRNNDQVVTTGATVYPRDLIIGNVVDAGFDDTGVAKYAILQPSADIGALEQVFIITQYNAG